MHKGTKGQGPDAQEMLLGDCCQAQLLDPVMASDAIHFMSLQVSNGPCPPASHPFQL